MYVIKDCYMRSKHSLRLTPPLPPPLLQGNTMNDPPERLAGGDACPSEPPNSSFEAGPFNFDANGDPEEITALDRGF